VTEYDPSDPSVPIPWALQHTIPAYLRRRTDWTPCVNAAVRMQYRAVFAPVDDAPWSPEHALPVEEQRFITPQEFRSSPAIIRVDARVLRALDDRPERILSLKWRDFEMFVANLLERLGYHTRLSPMGRDGGYDIEADRETDIGPERVLVQCKRFTPPMKVGVPIVKQFCTVIDDHRATRGLIATTSTFTSVALKYIEMKKHTVSGADLGKLREWMQRGR
jgi:hypothetical protein